MNSNPRKAFAPLIFAGVLILGILIGMRLNHPFNHAFLTSRKIGQFNKLSEVLRYIERDYVDTVSERKLVDVSIDAMLDHLDPHSAYIPAEDLQASNEPLEGNFDGIGIEFHLQNDTLLVVSPSAGGPSEMVGIRSGDRIVKVEGKSIAGVHISTNDIMQKLRGESGSKVNISIYRRGQKGLLDFTIKRGKIPIYSIDAAYMIDDSVGYIKISRFAATTEKEYTTAFNKLKQQGLKRLIIDLRDNPGGYLNEATQLADEFLSDKQLIVYTKGKARPKEEHYATTKGNFEQGKLVVLVNEGSASASEILSGALQDLDRATIIGRRSFGKGLVQEQTTFPDGSALRLTIARYYTPSGRCIQKSYKDGEEQYDNDLAERLKRGELQNADSIKFPDSLKYKTKAGRTVYGGGGIMPDIFVPLDTTMNTAFLAHVQGRGFINQFSYDYLDENRSKLSQYGSFEKFDKAFIVDDKLYARFVAYAKRQGVKADDKQVKRSARMIKTQLKAFIARQLWRGEGFFPIMQQVDGTLQRAYKEVKSQ